MKSFFALAAGAVLCIVGSAPVARALTVIPRSFDELVARAETVFKGTVVTVNPQWTGEGATRHIVTFVTFRVDETYKGVPAPAQTLRFLGGTVDGTTLEVPDMPTFTVGQRAVLFVTGNGQQYCPLVGAHQGRFHVGRDEAGVERVTTNDGSPVVNTTELGRFDADGKPTLHRYALLSRPGMTADNFRTEILGKVAALGQQPAGESKQTQR